MEKPAKPWETPQTSVPRPFTVFSVCAAAPPAAAIAIIAPSHQAFSIRTSPLRYATPASAASTASPKRSTIMSTSAPVTM